MIPLRRAHPAAFLIACAASRAGRACTVRAAAGWRYLLFARARQTERALLERLFLVEHHPGAVLTWILRRSLSGMPIRGVVAVGFIPPQEYLDA